MAVILHIETATDGCSVAVSQDGATIFHTDNFEELRSGGNKDTNHSKRLGVFIDEAMSFTDNHGIPFDAVAVSSGPGSYTGLRIGVSMAKGICYGQDLKFISVPTLQVLCVPVLLKHDDLPEDALICPMLDARRMEVYTALYTRALKPVVDTCAMVIDGEAFKEQLDKHPIYFFGNGAEKCKEVINHPNAHFIDGIELDAKNMAPLAEKRFLNEEFEDVAYFEPFYLKDFVATKAKKLL
ncbi:MAG: tRNA (adenosine(37)-N6)-threonylcarbamoyltransferase complex dimerization subunit type 1 TsaB [Bacteroidaceae bacterium]|jgi:tRNA threonylcarbamoyladenosine biosynthesis protein TsaB|nr:tRNA (adenosine(37)-N6)-threonylcarbamoyltransferase complex dimerization subunit type 1 TsaB [Bacteroidaceae bacterium]